MASPSPGRRPAVIIDPGAGLPSRTPASEPDGGRPHAPHRPAHRPRARARARPTRVRRDFRVDPDTGNNKFDAVFDAKLGERITAQSSAVSCDLRYDEKTGLASGRCSVPLTRVRVDNEDTKTEHFWQWVTNKKSDPQACRFEAAFNGVKIGALPPEQPVPFTAELPFTVCGRKPVDGRKEKVTGTALLFPPGSYGEKKTIRIRARIEGFDRDAYRIGPKYTEGWLARVQSLAKVVADQGTIDLSVFATSSSDVSASK